MKKETLEALKNSIKRKWEKIVRSSRALDKAGDNCSLCGRFGGFEDDTCKFENERCPVFKKTGQEECNGSPYENWTSHLRNVHGYDYKHREPGCKECMRLAKAELAFLKTLLPKGARP